MNAKTSRFSWAYGLAAAVAMALLPATMVSAEEGAIDEPNVYKHRELTDANKSAKITEGLIERVTHKQFALEPDNERRTIQLDREFQLRGLEQDRTRSIERNTRRAEREFRRANIRGRRLRSEPEAFQR